MSGIIYVITGKDGSNPSKASGWKDARKLLVYTTYNRAKYAMKSRMLSEDDYEIIEYTPKGSD